MNALVRALAKQLHAVANMDRAIGAKAYMRNICKKWIKEITISSKNEFEEIVRTLWNMEEREYQYCAIELMAYQKKQWNKDIISLVEYCIIKKSWWDTVDFIAAECTGPYFRMYPEKIKNITGSWNTSANMWLQRSSLLFQKSYKKDTDVILLSGYITQLAHSKEFFIRKAIGWILREYAKTNPHWVAHFVGTHELSPLSKREALKHL